MYQHVSLTTSRFVSLEVVEAHGRIGRSFQKIHQLYTTLKIHKTVTGYSNVFHNSCYTVVAVTILLSSSSLFEA